jgi:hypothetical protein
MRVTGRLWLSGEESAPGKMQGIRWKDKFTRLRKAAKLTE